MRRDAATAFDVVVRAGFENAMANAIPNADTPRLLHGVHGPRAAVSPSCDSSDSSTFDTLTGLPVRASLERAATQLLADRAVTSANVSLLVVDVGADALERLEQDGVGSQALLRGVARQLRNATRGTDFVARVDDRRFMALLPGSSLHDARSVLTRVHNALGRVLRRRQSDFASIRLAVVAAPDHGTTADDLLVAAERSIAKAWAVEPPTRLRITT